MDASPAPLEHRVTGAAPASRSPGRGAGCAAPGRWRGRAGRGPGRWATRGTTPAGRREARASSGRGRARRRVQGLDEVLDQRVDPHRVAGVRPVPAADERHERAAGQLGQPPADDVGADAVVVPWATRTGQRTRPQAPRPRRTRRRRTRGARPWRRPAWRLDLVAPADAVLDLLGRVRLGDHPLEEPLHEVVVATLQPVAPVVLGPPSVVS